MGFVEGVEAWLEKSKGRELGSICSEFSLPKVHHMRPYFTLKGVLWLGVGKDKERVR